METEGENLQLSRQLESEGESMVGPWKDILT